MASKHLAHQFSPLSLVITLAFLPSFPPPVCLGSLESRRCYLWNNLWIIVLCPRVRRNLFKPSVQDGLASDTQAAVLGICVMAEMHSYTWGMCWYFVLLVDTHALMICSVHSTARGTELPAMVTMEGRLPVPKSWFHHLSSLWPWITFFPVSYFLLCKTWLKRTYVPRINKSITDTCRMASRSILYLFYLKYFRQCLSTVE